MELKEFIGNFANQFDETDESAFQADTVIESLDEWSSLTTLAVMNMIGKKYGVIIRIDDIRQARTILDLFNMVESRQK